MPSFYYFKLFVLKELNSSKIIQINPSGIISTQSRTQQIMLEEGLVFVMMTKLKGGILDHSFFRNQREPGMTTIPLVNKRDPELKKEFIVSCHKVCRCFDSSRKLNIRLVQNG